MSEQGERVESSAEGRVRAARREVLELESERLAIAAHDVKNGLNVVSLAAHQLLGLRIEGEEGAKLKRIAEMLQRASRRVTDTMRDLVDLARIEAGHVKVEQRPFELTRLVDEVLERERPLQMERGVRIQVDLEPGLEHARMVGDFDRARAALGALISNATRFSPERGLVQVTVRNEGPRVRIAVRDEGPGIAPERLARIFVRPAPVRGDPRSLGRGLPLAKGLVEALGGTLHVDTELGAGSTFSLALPWSPPSS